MPAEQWNNEQMLRYVNKQYEEDAPGVMDQIERWLERGDGAAIYENHDLGSPEIGMPKIVSYGSPRSQLETDEPPTTLPDIGNAINWRFQLVATYRG
jgi:hypothetical protein